MTLKGSVPYEILRLLDEHQAPYVGDLALLDFTQDEREESDV